MKKFYIKTSAGQTMERLNATTLDEAIEKAIECAGYIADWGDDIVIIEHDGNNEKRVAKLPWNIDIHEAMIACFGAYANPDNWQYTE